MTKLTGKIYKTWRVPEWAFAGMGYRRSDEGPKGTSGVHQQGTASCAPAGMAHQDLIGIAQFVICRGDESFWRSPGGIELGCRCCSHNFLQ